MTNQEIIDAIHDEFKKWAWPENQGIKNPSRISEEISEIMTGVLARLITEDYDLLAASEVLSHWLDEAREIPKRKKTKMLQDGVPEETKKRVEKAALQEIRDSLQHELDVMGVRKKVEELPEEDFYSYVGLYYRLQSMIVDTQREFDMNDSYQLQAFFISICVRAYTMGLQSESENSDNIQKNINTGNLPN